MWSTLFVEVILPTVLKTTFSLSFLPSGVESWGMLGISNKIVLMDSKIKLSVSFLFFRIGIIYVVF